MFLSISLNNRMSKSNVSASLSPYPISRNSMFSPAKKPEKELCSGSFKDSIQAIFQDELIATMSKSIEEKEVKKLIIERASEILKNCFDVKNQQILKNLTAQNDYLKSELKNLKVKNLELFNLSKQSQISSEIQTENAALQMKVKQLSCALRHLESKKNKELAEIRDKMTETRVQSTTITDLEASVSKFAKTNENLQKNMISFNEQSKQKDEFIENLNLKITDLEKKIIQLKSKNNLMKKENESIMLSVKNLESLTSSLQEKVKQKKQELKKEVRNRESLDKQMELLKNEMNEFQEQKYALLLNQSNNLKMENMNYESEITNLKVEIGLKHEQLKEEKIKLENWKNKNEEKDQIIDSLKDEVDAKYKELLLRDKEELIKKSEIDDYQSELIEKNKKLKQFENVINFMKNTHEKMENEHNQILVKLIAKEKEVDQLKVCSDDTVKESLDLKQQIKNANEKWDFSQQEIEIMKKELKTLKYERDEIEKVSIEKITNLNNTIDELNGQLEKKQTYSNESQKEKIDLLNKEILLTKTHISDAEKSKLNSDLRIEQLIGEIDQKSVFLSRVK